MAVIVNEGWEDRYERVKHRTRVQIDPHPILDPLLADNIITEEEWHRSEWKIELIEPFLTRMVVNMVKGTLKYPRDDWDAATWKDMGMDDKADSVNYDLLEDHFREQGMI